MNKKTISPIAYIHTDYPSRFGIPRQCGLVENEGTIVFEEAYRSPDFVRELDGYSHIWLIWGFSENEAEGWQPTVRPPRLGGSRSVGVFASRSPLRPNGLGLSVVRLLKVDMEDGSSGSVPILHVSGADLMDQTPIYDIKPYMPSSDSVPEASAGYARTAKDQHLEVQCRPDLVDLIPEGKRKALFESLALDPRSPYQKDTDRAFCMGYAGLDVRFQVEGNTLTVLEVVPARRGGK